MAKEWTDEEVAEEIGKAVQIVREDRIDTLIRNRLSATPNNPPNPENNPPPSSGNPSNDNPGDTGKKKGSLWWGTEDLSAAAN
jgi:hypothetical protein